MTDSHSDEMSYLPPALRPPQPRDSRMARHRSVTNSTSTNGDAATAISHTFLLWVFRQWWKLTIPIGIVLAVIAGVGVLLFHVQVYESSGLLLIEDVSPFVAFSAHDKTGDSDRYVQTQLELLRSPVVLNPVLGRAEIANMAELRGQIDRVTYLRSHLSVKQVGRSELYDISYKSPSAQDAANVVNAVAAEYINLQEDDEFKRSQRVIEILEEERHQRGLGVERLRQQVVDLAKEVTGRDPFGGNEVVDANRALNPVGALFQSLTEVEVDREVRRAQLKSLADGATAADSYAKSSGLLDLEIETDPFVRSCQQAVKDVESQIEELKVRLARFNKSPNFEDDPHYLILSSTLTQRQKDLAEAKAKARRLIVEKRAEERKQEQSQRLADMKRDLASLDARRELLAQRFSDQVKEAKSSSAKSVELEFKRSELEREEKVFELIASRKLQLQTELHAPPRIQLRQKAIAPLTPIEPIPYKLLLLACCASFAAPFGLAVLREITVRRISDTQQLAQDTGLRVLGDIASLPVRYVASTPNQLTGRLRRDTYVFAESVNSLRTNLALSDGRHGCVYAVTSACPSEGKTSVAVSLALSIASATEGPTLIIDGDMRSPFAASMLKAKSQPGLFEVLTKKATVDDALQPVAQQSQLWILPAGRATKSTHSVVDVGEIQRLLESLRSRFNVIIIDTPPILAASESMVLAKAADSVLFCALANVSKSKQVRLAIERMEHANINIAGAVLSGMPAKQYEYLYGYYAHRIETQN